MFAVTTDLDPATGLPGVPALLTALDAAWSSPRVLHLLTLAAHEVDDADLVAAGPLCPVRVAATLAQVAERFGARLFRVSSSTFAIITDRDGCDVMLSADARAALAQLAPAAARQLLHGRTPVPAGSGHAQPVLDEALAGVRTHVAWQPQSPARQASDVLVQVLRERNLADGGPHRARIAANAVATGRELCLAPAELHEMVRAAELQDVGLLALPETILQKRGPLDDHEWHEVRRHPLAGQRIVAASTALTGVARLVRSCYERYDGSGYPDGLSGEDIPLAARIIAVCVAYEAMVTGRPYRAPRGPGETLAELEACAGHQFDPLVVAAFHRVVEPS